MKVAFMDKSSSTLSNLGQLGEQLKSLRQQQKLSMSKLSKVTGLSAAFICRIESGERRPSREKLDTLLKILMPAADTHEKDKLLIMAGFAPQSKQQFIERNDILELYRKALARNPQDFSTYIAMVLHHIRQGQFKKATASIEGGLDQFNDKIQMSALIAALELSNQNFDKATQHQAEAISLFEQCQNPDKLYLKRSDLELSYGIIYFEWGNTHAYNYQQARLSQQSKLAQSELKKALKLLYKALEHCNTALNFNHDLYVVDELARIHFTLAYLQNNKESKPHWESSIRYFERILQAHDSESLGYRNQLQSTSFLALAQANVQRFEEAFNTLNIIHVCLPHFWLAYYIRSCCLVIQARFEKEQRESLYDLALQALQKSLNIDDENNRSRKEIPLDLDLAELRAARPVEFAQLLEDK